MKALSWVLGWSLLPACACGCGGTRSRGAYVPTGDVAQKALDAVLQAWQQGQPAGKIAGSTPTVQGVDTHRRPGQTLQGYAILGEVAGDSPRCFAVRLRLHNPPQEQTSRFVVIGINPLWVFRHEDYEMLAHWDHRMGDSERANKSTAKP